MNTHTLPISRFAQNTLNPIEDVLAVEEPLEISLCHGAMRQTQNISVTMRTPGEDAALAVGFLFTEGILQKPEQIEAVTQVADNQILVSIKPEVDLDLGKLERHFYTSSSCGVCGKSSIAAIGVLGEREFLGANWQLSPEIVLGMNEQVRKLQAVFQHTGGLHASALFARTGECLGLQEDVGRHNALDKLIGKAFLAGQLPLRDKLLFLSGRASFELIQKAAMAGIPVVCALGAPSSLAVELAQNCNMTLIGFVKAETFNVYSNGNVVLGG